MEVLSENSINRWVVPHLGVGKRGPKLQVKSSEIVSAILYKLKTGCQWRKLPTKEFFAGRRISWQGVYYHFSKWANDGSLRKVWTLVVLEEGEGDLDRIGAGTRVIAVDTPNSNTVHSDWGTYRTSVDAIERATGYDLLSAVPAQVQKTLESQVDTGPTE